MDDVLSVEEVHDALLDSENAILIDFAAQVIVAAMDEVMYQARNYDEPNEGLACAIAHFVETLIEQRA